MSEAFDDTNPHIVLAETRQEARALRRDVTEHDGKISTLQEQVTRVDERVRFLARTYWLIAGGVAALIGDAVLRHFH